jgi:hypothetical protein
MNHIKMFLCTILVLGGTPLHGDEVISFFLKPYPMTPEFSNTETKKLKNAGKIAHYTTHGILNKDTVSGIFVSYAGFLDISDSNGQFTFPRQHEDPLIYLLITPYITPILIANNTIHHWELETGTPATMYVLEKKQDPATDLYFWDTQQVELPKNRIIPLETCIVFAKPYNIVVPNGITLSNDAPNLILPDIYVKKGIKIYPSTLYLLNLKQFFGPIDRISQEKEKLYSSHVVY